MKKSSLILLMAIAWMVPFVASAADIDEATIEVIDVNADHEEAVTNRIELPDDGHDEREDHKDHDRNHDVADDRHDDHDEAQDREEEREHEGELEEEREQESDDKSEDGSDDHRS